MSERQGVLVSKGLLIAGALAALLLLVSFYFVVHSGVDRAAQRRAEAADNARLSTVSGALSAAAPRFAALTAAAR